MVVLKKEFDSVINEIKEIVLITDSEEYDLTLAFIEISIIESIRNVFYTGEIVFNDQYNFRETVPFKGNEKIRISWKTSLSNDFRTNTFILKSIPSIQQKTNAVDMNHFQLVDERYKKMLSSQYYGSYSNKTLNTIVTDICKHHKVKITTGLDLSGITFFNTFKNSLKAIEYLRKLNNKPYVFFQQNQSIIFKSYEELFKQDTELEFITIPKRNDTKLIENWNKNDLFDLTDVYVKGENGYKKFNSDTFAGTSSVADVELSNAKFVFDDNFLNVRLNDNSSYIEKNYFNDYLQFKKTNPDSDVMVGKIADIKMWIDIQAKEISKYSGKWLITDVIHKITSDLKYEQNLICIKESPII